MHARAYPLPQDCRAVYPQTPFERIALTFSGGGFRAAAYSLGCLSYLHRCRHAGDGSTLLDKVKFITSTSGGSLTNGRFASALYADPAFSFETFYREMKASLDGETLLEQVFALLKNDAEWPAAGTGKACESAKSRNLINAFALAYDRHLFKGRTLDTFYAPPYKPSLEKVCFNTTEFNNGLAFYFQVNGHMGSVDPYGNGYLTLKDPDIIRHLKIADIVAASSCFPGGFEPLVYPRDFTHAGLTDADAMQQALAYEHNNPLRLETVRKQPIAFMDGGIVDNMGIRSVMLEDSRRLHAGEGSFDLILACDVTSYFVEPLRQKGPEGESWWRRLTAAQLLLPLRLAPLVLLLCLLSLVFDVWVEAGLLLLLPALGGTLLAWGARRGLRRLQQKSGGAVVKTLLRHLDYFLQLPLASLLHMVSTRLASATLLVSDLFLKNIRRGQYDNLFTKPRLVHRTISCLIYEFSSAHQATRLRILRSKDKAWWTAMEEQLMPGAAMQAVADEARSMGTTLWFDESDVKEEKRDKIIAAGQFTMCYNLIKHICRLEMLDARYRTEGTLQALKQRLLLDFQRFRNDPLFLVELEKDGQGSGD